MGRVREGVAGGKQRRNVLSHCGELALDDSPDEEVVHIVVTVDQHIAKGDDALVFADPYGDGRVAFCK